MIHLFHSEKVALYPVFHSLQLVCRAKLFSTCALIHFFSRDPCWPMPSFFVTAAPQAPLFLSSMTPFSTQKPLSRIAALPVLSTFLHSRRSKLTAVPRFSCSGFCASFGQSFPSASSFLCILSLTAQQIARRSLPNGCGFLGTNVHLGQDQRLNHMLMLSSKQLTHEGVKFSCARSFNSSMS